MKETVMWLVVVVVLVGGLIWACIRSQDRASWTYNEAIEEGRAAYKIGLPVKAVPYSPNNLTLYEGWKRGWGGAFKEGK